MRHELCLRYERLMKSSSGGSDVEVEEEQALYAGHQFKGKCYVCGKIGHKGANCRERTNKQNKRFQGRGGRGMGLQQGMNSGRGFLGNCNYCHKFGHKAADCIKRKSDLENRSNSNGIRRQEAADVSLNVQEMELAFMAEEWEFGYCVHCGGRGPLGTFCDRCVDSGCIYASTQYEDEGVDEYENDTEDDEMNEENNIEENKNESNDEDEDGNLDEEFEQQVLKNEIIVLLRTQRNSNEYIDRLRRNTTGNTSQGLFDFCSNMYLKHGK
jgi:hypothetical protein